MAQSFQDVNNDLSKMVPFLLERKYCYYEPDSRNNINMSKYNFNTAQKPLIAKKYNNNKQIDDIVKDNFVNVFTNNLLISDYNLIYPLLNTYHYTKPLFIDNHYKSTINNNFTEKKLQNKNIIINYFNNI